MMSIWSPGKKIIMQCCGCYKVRNESGEWDFVKEPPQDKKPLISHTVCPDCLVKLYPDLASAIGLNQQSENAAP